jgi:hypothetical protein
MAAYTKTFVQHRFYRKQSVTEWIPFPETRPEHRPLDDQVREWVDDTRVEVIHPGQVGIAKEWFEDGTVLCIILGLTVLYREPRG